MAKKYKSLKEKNRAAQKRYREKQKLKGYRELKVLVHDEDRVEVVRYAAQLRETRQEGEAHG